MKYVVKQLWLSGKGKKMFKSGDVVTANDFPNNFEELIKEGRIVCIKEQTGTPEPPKSSETEGLTEGQGSGEENEGTEFEEGQEGGKEDSGTTEPPKSSEPLFYFDPQGENRAVCNENDLNKKELIQELSKRNIAFNPADKKEPLWSLLVSNL